MTKVCHEIVIDHTISTITMDGVEFPFYVTPDIQLDLTADTPGAPAIVHLGVITENLRVVSAQGETTVIASSDPETNLRWARARARDIVIEGMYDVLEWLKGGKD